MNDSMRGARVARFQLQSPTGIIDVVEKEIPWVANRVLLLATFIVHSIMCLARIETVDCQKPDRQGGPGFVSSPS
jgi:hypothetical protein